MKKTRILASVLALAMCVSAMPMSAFAATTLDQQQATVNVTMSVGSTYEVTIPKNITLDGTSKTGSYTVVVNGNIAGTEQVSVVPDAEFQMTQSGKDAITATVSKVQQVFTSAELAEGKTTTGTISAPDATAGTWAGSLNFNIALEATEAQAKEPATVIEFQIIEREPVTYQAEQGMTWEEWVNSEYNTNEYQISMSKVLDMTGDNYVSATSDSSNIVKADEKIESGKVYHSVIDL